MLLIRPVRPENNVVAMGPVHRVGRVVMPECGSRGPPHVLILRVMIGVQLNRDSKDHLLDRKIVHLVHRHLAVGLRDQIIRVSGDHVRRIIRDQ